MGELKIGRAVLGWISTNCYFVFDPETMETVVFDPGDDGKRLYDRLNEKGLHVAGIVLTHGHYDHIYGVDELKEASGAKVYAPLKEKEFLLDPDLNQSSAQGRVATVKADVYLEDNEVTDINGIRFRTLWTPGHTIGSSCFYFEEDKILIAGDTLFLGSVGRTDMPTGSMGDLIQSIRKKILVLPDDVRVYPGHGDDTTVGYERKYNPFCC
ncbi:MAG: MBL fold metallo-hydrolase [Lachnospiraceae bacterium]|nr:MBL fold metallo-hydrolase [Lachnospiraceae bacterium]